MSTRTYYYNLIKPDGYDHVERGPLNANADTIDTQMHANAEAAREAAENAADAYDDTASYTAGDLAIYQSKLFKATAATSGAFDPTKWQQTSIAAEFERKHKWELLKTITADGNTARYDETIPAGCIGLFIEVHATTAAANDNIHTYISFSDAPATWRRLGVVTNGITTAERYTQFRYERDGENYWQGTQANPAAANQGMSLQVRQNGYIFTDATLEKLRINTDTNAFPSGSTITIYVKQ